MPYVFDAKNNKAPIIITKKESPFQRSKRLQTAYERALRGVAREVGKLISGYAGNDPLDLTTANRLAQALRAYSELISPWALKLTGKILTDVESQDRFAWRQHSKDMSLALRKEIENAPTGEVLKQLMAQNVLLIKSIPLEAAQRVHKLVQENMMQSGRASEIAAKIMQTENVTKSRATLIARTEISKASTALTQSRALYVKSDGYIWRSSKDLLVRPSHRAMNGVFVKWSEPPTLDKMVGHAGSLPNCRCWPQPIIPED